MQSCVFQYHASAIRSIVLLKALIPSMACSHSGWLKNFLSGPSKQIKQNKNMKKAPKIKVKKTTVTPELARLRKEVANLRVTPKTNTSFHLSECGKKYLIAQASPFSTAAMGCCIPHEPAPNSQKATVKTSFTMSIGGAGNASSGALYFAPCLNSDTPCVYYTDSTKINLAPTSDLTGSQLLPFCNAAYFNSPYTSTDLTLSDYNTPAASGRIVSFGVRIKSETATNFNGGVMYYFSDPSHSNTARVPKTTVLSQAQCARMPISERTKTVGLEFSIGPQFVDEQQYPSLGGVSYNNDCVLGNYPLSRTQNLVSYNDPDRYGNGVVYNKVTSVASGTDNTITLASGIARNMSETETVIILDADKNFVGYTNLNASAVAGANQVVLDSKSGVVANGYLASGVPSKLSESYSGGDHFFPGGAPCVVYIEPSNSSTTCTYLVEIIAHLEFVGTKTSALQTPSHGDTFALSKITSSMSQVPALIAASPYTPWIKLAAQAVIRGFESYSGVGMITSSMAAKVIQAALKL